MKHFFKTMALAAASLILSLGSAIAQPSAIGNSQRPDGTWLIYITPDPGCPCTPFINITTYNANGTVEGFAVDQTQFTGRGEWLRTGNRDFSLAFYSLNRDEKGGSSTASKVTGTMRIGDSNPDEGTGTAKLQVLDTTGRTVFTATFKFKATRIRADQ